MRWVYRLRQFLLRARPRGPSIDRERARAVLPEGAYRLFEKMSPGDRAHALCVARLLRRRGQITPEVEQAALLHDVGKVGGGLALPYRGLVVILNRINGHWLDHLAKADPASWRYPFYVHLHHAELGACWCERAGCPALTVALVRHHESALDSVGDPVLAEKLARLQQADNMC